MAGSYELLNHVPYIALVLCLALASGVYIGLAEWTRGIAHGHYNHKTTFQTITPWLKVAFFTVLLVSLVRQILFLDNEQTSYIAELVLLVFLSTLFLLHRKFIRKESIANIIQSALNFFKKIGIYCLLVSIFWIILLGFFLASLFFIQSINLALSLTVNALQISVFATGLIALFPFYFWYNNAKKGAAENRLETPEHYKFHHILWPFIVALFLFILPLLMEKIADSDKFHDLMNTKPSLQRV